MSDSEFVYLFPANKRGQATTIEGQLYYIEEEWKELEAELLNSGESLATMKELFDVYVSTESLMRKFDQDLVRQGYSATLAKGRERGDWE